MRVNPRAVKIQNKIFSRKCQKPNRVGKVQNVMAGSLTKPNTVKPSSRPKLFTRKMREMTRNETTAVVRHKEK